MHTQWSQFQFVFQFGTLKRHVYSPFSVLSLHDNSASSVAWGTQHVYASVGISWTVALPGTPGDVRQWTQSRSMAGYLCNKFGKSGDLI